MFEPGDATKTNNYEKYKNNLTVRFCYHSHSFLRSIKHYIVGNDRRYIVVLAFIILLGYAERNKSFERGESIFYGFFPEYT